MKKTALITGVSGQDGSYLASLLLNKNYKIIGSDRRSSRDSGWRLKFLNIEKKIIYEDLDLLEINNIIRLFDKYNFDEVYNLAAQSFVKSSFLNPISTANVTAIGVLNILEVIRNKKKKIKFYQASSSEMFGNTKTKNQNEKTPFNPQSPYAISKLFAHHITKNYREAYKMYAVNGILFNHESPLRGEEFITRKITKGFAKIMSGDEKPIVVGNIYSKRDWGYAYDYVEAMWKMLQQKQPEDFVIATGKSYTIKQFINYCADALNLNTKWVGKGLKEKLINKKNSKCLIKIDPIFFRPSEVNDLKGNYSKALKKLGWKPKTDLKNLIKLMIREDLKNYNFRDR